MQMSISLNNSTVLVLVKVQKFELTRTRTRTRRFWTLVEPMAKNCWDPGGYPYRTIRVCWLGWVIYQSVQWFFNGSLQCEEHTRQTDRHVALHTNTLREHNYLGHGVDMCMPLENYCKKYFNTYSNSSVTAIATFRLLLVYLQTYVSTQHGLCVCVSVCLSVG